ncbi:uncharacterized protein RCO7_03884 [Rhynchosporium graminicola]|uniref:Uncharacterized protein n=1 Tax=Rhynchosporium graminicola TaxID=2792576 RepID=A0A1E1LLN7_9HELO|nr:uncharacterized protein RCO7_03884 [Rhynchosporium commune]
MNLERIIHELEIKHARQLAELRAKQEPEVARRNCEDDSRLRSVSIASRERKRRRESVVTEKRPEVSQQGVESTIKIEVADDDFIIVSSSKRFRSKCRDSQIRIQSPIPSESEQPPPPPVEIEEPLIIPVTNNSDPRNSSVAYHDMSRIESPDDAIHQQQSLSPVQDLVKSESEDSGMPYLDIGNLQPGSFETFFSTHENQRYPACSVPAAPRLPDRHAISEKNSFKEPLCSIIDCLASPASKFLIVYCNFQPETVTVQSFQWRLDSKFVSASECWTKNRTDRVATAASSVGVIPQNTEISAAKIPVSAVLESTVPVAAIPAPQTLEIPAIPMPPRLEKNSKKSSSLPKVVTATFFIIVAPITKENGSSRKVGSPLVPSVAQNHSDPTKTPVPVRSRTPVLQSRPVLQTVAHTDQPVSRSLADTIDNAGRKAPITPMMTTPSTSRAGGIEKPPETTATEISNFTVHKLSIRGAANRIFAAARVASNHQPVHPTTMKTPSIEGAPTGPRAMTQIQRVPKTIWNPNMIIIPPRDKSSSEAYESLTSLPPNATEVAIRIFPLPTLRPLRLNPKRTRGIPGNLEASLGQLRGQIPFNGCRQCTRDKERMPFEKCIVVAGEFSGACCNCRFFDEGRDCSLRVASVTRDTPEND